MINLVCCKHTLSVAQMLREFMITQPYRERRIHPLGVRTVGPLRMKMYWISSSGRPPSDALLSAADLAVEERVRSSAERTNHYGVGFVGIHEGATGSFVFVDWWADENELHHHVYTAQLHGPSELKYATPSGLSACVWDLNLIAHERDAWVSHVLAKPRAPDMDGYLEDQLTMEPTPKGDPESAKGNA